MERWPSGLWYFPAKEESVTAPLVQIQLFPPKKENLLEHKCKGVPCYVSRKEANKIIIEALENDEVKTLALEWVLDTTFNNIHIVYD